MGDIATERQRRTAFQQLLAKVRKAVVKMVNHGSRVDRQTVKVSILTAASHGQRPSLNGGSRLRRCPGDCKDSGSGGETAQGC